MRRIVHDISPERYLAGAAFVSVAVAGIASQIPAIAFGGFVPMASVLLAADLVIYALAKFRLLKTFHE